MLDPKLLRSDLPGVAAALARRGFVLDVRSASPRSRKQRKAAQIEADRLRAERNANAKAVGFAKSKGPGCWQRCWPRGEALGAELQSVEKRLEAHSGATRGSCKWVCRISCTPASRRDATKRPTSRCAAGASREPLLLNRRIMSRSASRLGMDFEAAGRISGARFVVMTGDAGQAASGACAIHARSARARSRLSRGLCAVPGARHGARGYRATAEVRAGPIRGARRSRLLPDSRPPKCR